VFPDLAHELSQQGAVSDEVGVRVDCDHDEHGGRDVDEQADDSTQTDPARPAPSRGHHAVVHRDGVQRIRGR